MSEGGERLRLMTVLQPGAPTLLQTDPSRPESRTAYEVLGGYGHVDSETLMRNVIDADVRGCGGAGFPTARKIETVVRASATRRVVVVNGAESEPTSLKDRFLLQYRPHLVLDGAHHLARILETDLVFIAVGDDSSRSSMLSAIADSPIDVKPRVSLLRGGYVKGEETAVIAALNGRKSLPLFKPPRPFERGVAGYPTLMLNVETVAQIALLGAAPIPRDRLPRVATVSRRSAPPRLVSCARDSLIEDVLGVDTSASERSVMPSGFFGGLAPWTMCRSVRILDWEGLRAPFSAGSLGMVAIEEADCPVAAVTGAAHYLAGENARQCGSCVNGTVALAAALRELAEGTASSAVMDNLSRWSVMLPGRGACSVPDGVARLASDLLTRFPEVVTRHRGEKCRICAERSFNFGVFGYETDPSILVRVEVVS